MVGVVVVADGNSGEVATDPSSSLTVADPAASVGVADPLTYQWSRVPHDEVVFGGARGQCMKSVTVGGPGLVAVGSVANDAVGYDLRNDEDADAGGVDFCRRDHLVAGCARRGDLRRAGRGEMSSVTAGGPGLVAVGSDGDFAAVWTSVDGIIWSRVAHDEAVFGGRDGVEMSSVTAGGPGLVAVGSDGDFAAVWISVDGITWSRVAHDEAVFGGLGPQGMNSVTVGGPGLVAVGVGAGRRISQWEENRTLTWQVHAPVWTSVDGLTWSRVAHDEAVFGGLGAEGQGISSVIAAGPGLVAVGDVRDGGQGSDAAVWTSVDGITWSRVPHDMTLVGGTGSQRMYSVTVTGAGLVAVGVDGGYYRHGIRYERPDAVVWTSVDGITWSRVAHDEPVFGGAGMHSVTVTGRGPGGSRERIVGGSTRC